MHTFILATALAFPSLASDLRAQHPQTREGFNASFGVGGGNAGVRCDQCTDGPRPGTLFYVNFGGTLRQHWTLGGELNGFGYSDNEQDITIGSLMAVAHFYPESAAGFFLTGGTGITSTTITRHCQATETSSIGYGVEAGLGYDVRLRRDFSVTPYLQYVKGFGDRTMTGGVAMSSALAPSYWQVGLGFTWH